jgi:hypothetical protein
MFIVEQTSQRGYDLGTVSGIGMSDATQGYACGRQAVQAALAQLNGDPVALALLFTSHPQPDEVLKGVNNTLGAVPLIGATSAGQYSHEGYVEQGAGVMLIQSDHIQFHPTVYRRRLLSGRRLLGRLRGISKEGLGSTHHHRALMLFPDDRSMNLDSVVERAMTETAMLYDILGGPGPTTHDTPPRPPAVFHNNRVIPSGLSGAEILSPTPLGMALTNGWTPLSGPYRVTQADERRIIKLDGRPAWEVYEDFLSEQGIAYSPETLPRILLNHPVGVCENGDCKVSVLMGFDDSGALRVTSPPAAGQLIHLLSTETDAMVTAAERAIQQAVQRLDTHPGAGALFIDCMSTGWVLEDAYPRQQAAVQNCLGDVPFLGFRSHGVLARLQGQTAGHYECSVAACLLPG